MIIEKVRTSSGADLGQILTDFLNERRRRKLLRGSGGRLPQERFRIFNSFKSLSWISESFRRDIGQIQLGKCLKYIYEKSADSVQRWKLVWFCACKGTLGIGTKAFKQIFLKHLQKLTYNLPCT